jgi:hypothetical protein
VSVAFSAGGDGVHHVALIDAQIAEPCWWRHSPTSICLRKILPLDRGGKGRARWTLRLLENKVVELGIVDRASDSTIGRALKKTLFSPIAASTGSSRRRPTARS